MSKQKPDIRTIVTLSDQVNIDLIIDHVANGGTIIDLCKMWAIKYSDVMRVIRANESYKKSYDQALLDRDEWAKERILSEVKALSTYTIKDALNADGTFKALKDMPDHLAAAIKEVDLDGNLKFSDKLKALDLLGKQLGIFIEKKEISGRVTLEQLILEAHSSMKDEANGK